MSAQRIECGLLAEDGVAHGFFTRQGGVSTGVYASLNGGRGSRDEPAAVAQNLALMAGALGVAREKFLVPYLTHSPDCVIVDAPFGNDRPKCDALVTKTRGLALGVTGADCGILLFSDPGAGVIGAAHAGWKGAFTGVLESTLQAMEQIGASRPAIRVVLGPTIAKSSYEVGPEFRGRFLAQNAGNARFFGVSDKAGHFMFDLPAYIGARLMAEGVGEFRNLALDTYADEARFYSYRRSVHRGEPDYGRLVAAIALV
ncbi:MAG: peptidoglycan editing factor PgeF [Hyphomicrobiales bacterium]|nr:peptidoglycan editing factor PgeF [Hyphomicrobiales bacterium]